MSTTRTNLCPNPQPTKIDGWSASAAGALVTAPWGRQAVRTTAGADTPYVFSAPVGSSTSAGTSVTIRCKIKHSNPSAVVRVSIMDQATYAYLISSDVTLGPNWLEVTVSGTVTAAVAQLAVSVVQWSGVVAGETIMVGDVLIETGSSVSPVYFDGDTPDNTYNVYSWTGAASGSTSTWVASPLPTLDLAWIPGQGAVRFSVTGVPDDDLTTVKRVTPGGTLQAIRGYPDGTWHGTSGLGYDYEAPMSVAVRYAIVGRDAKNLMPSDVVAAIFTQTPGRTNGEAWLRDVLSPILSRPVSVVSTGDETYVARQSILDVTGRTNPFVVWDSRSGRQGTVTLAVANKAIFGVWDDATDRLKLQALFTSGRPLLLSICANKGFPNGYLAIDAVTYTRMGTQPAWLVTLDYIEVDNPTGLGVEIIPEVTYAVAQQLPPNATYQAWYGTGVGDGATYFDIATRTA